MKRILASVVLLALSAAVLFAFEPTSKPVSSGGVRAVLDIPASEHMQNVGGSDGAGLCVYTSVVVSARWHNLPAVYGLRKFAEGRPGGSWPEKLAEDLKVYANRNNVTIPPFIQHTGGDDQFLDLVFQTRRAPAVTYAGVDDFYSSPIAHMVNGAHLDAKDAAIIDNNRAGKWLWMSRAQFLNRWKGYNDDGSKMLVPVRRGLRTEWVHVGGGWAFVWLGPPAPPVPPKVADFDPPAVSPYVWERWSENDESPVFWLLYKDGELAYVVDPDGNWHKAIGPHSYDPEVVEKPTDVPQPSEEEPTDDWNKGVDPTKVSRTYRYWINGVEVSRAAAYAAVADPIDLVDDSDKYHLSVVGDEAEVRKLFLGPLAKYATRVHLQVYKPADWVAKDRLAAVVTLQEPAKIGGKIVGTAGSVDELPTVLARVFDVPEPINPKPDGGEPTTPAGPDDVNPWWKVLLAAVLAWLAVKLGGKRGS